MRAARWWSLLGLIIAPLTASAFEILDVRARHAHDRYDLAFDVWVDADPAAARRLLTDYERLDRLSATVTDSRVLARNAHRTRVAITLRACVLWMCRTIKEVEDVHAIGDGGIEGNAIPAQSDFHYLHERWQILPDNGGTRVRYTAAMKPKFFVPPLVGPWLMKIKMRDELQTSAQRLEALAHAHE